MRNSYRILICEPDERSRQALKANLGAGIHKLVWCGSSAEAVVLLKRGDVDAAVFCLATDGMPLEVLDWIDKTSCDVPALVATSDSAIELRILGLERGAADYLIKPFGMDELVVRVSTVLHRRVGKAKLAPLRGNVKLDMETGYCGIGGKWLTLTPKERQAFSLLLEHGEHPVSRNRLKDAIADGKRMSDNALEVVIYRLRTKASQWGMNIRAYRGSGYVLEYP